MQAEIYQEREREKMSMFERAGISQMSANAKLPDGVRLDSSKALREFNMVENQRFAKQAQRYEQFFIDVAQHIIELCAEMYKGGTNRKTTFLTRSVIDEIEWSDVQELFKGGRSMDLQIEASSVTNMTPAAREDTVNTWVFNGWITPERGMELIGIAPDIEEEMAMLGARIKDIKRTLEQLDRNVSPFPTPIPYQDLESGIRMAQLTLLRRRGQKDVPPEVIDNYEVWISQAMGLRDQAAAMSNASQKLQEQQAMAELQGGMQPAGADALQANLAPPNVGPEGNMLPGVATTTQGTPVSALI